MTLRVRSSFAAGALVTGLITLAGCTAGPAVDPLRDPGKSGVQLRLVAFDSCDEVLDRFTSAAKAYVGPWGFHPPTVLAERAAAAPGDAQRVAKAVDGDTPEYSGTNTHEAGVDEPDLVKTDGRRIVTVLGGVLRVVDPASRQVTGELDLRANPGERIHWRRANLLVHGDRALVLIPEGWSIAPTVRPRVGVPGMPPGPDRPSAQPTGPRLILVDLATTPRIVSEYRTDGSLIDARQVGAIARVVVRSAPHLTFPQARPTFPQAQKLTDAQRIEANRDVIDDTTAEDWLPHYTLTTDGTTRTGWVGCDRVSMPASFSGTSMVTMLSFDLGRPALGDGDPVTVVADGDTVYSNGEHLYLTHDQRWRITPRRNVDGEVAPEPHGQITEIYQFDTSGQGRPRYVTAGSVPGWLINQYAISEWDGHLRVATTSRGEGQRTATSSGVYVLRVDGKTLTEIGQVTGLGKGERIYAVRFVGPVGYVVTFRQTDPLYTVDLRKPAAPTVAGELKITGYSAYLHPVADGRLLGIGQEASTRGRSQGTQVSLFDVTDLTKPTRVARHHVRGGHSEAEFDPHAFLYWPEDRLLVVPLTVYPADETHGRIPAPTALVLRVNDGGFSELGRLTHPALDSGRTDGHALIRRSLVVDDVLWTVSDAGLKATQISTMDTLTWLPLT